MPDINAVTAEDGEEFDREAYFGKTIDIDEGEHHVSDKGLTSEEAAAELADLVAKVGAKTMTGEADREVVFKFDERITMPEDNPVVVSDYRPATQSKALRAEAQEIAASEVSEALETAYSTKDALALVRAALASVRSAVDHLETALDGVTMEDVLEESVVDA